MTLTKAHIIDGVAEQIGYTRKKANDTLEILLEIIKSRLGSGEDVLVSGFGKFCVNEKRERKGRNPASGKDMMLPPRKVVTFRSSRQLRKILNC